MPYRGHFYWIGLLSIGLLIPWVTHIFDHTFLEKSPIAYGTTLWSLYGAIMYALHPKLLPIAPKLIKNLTVFALFGLLPIMPLLLPIVMESYYQYRLRRFKTFTSHELTRRPNLSLYITQPNHWGSTILWLPLLVF